MSAPLPDPGPDHTPEVETFTEWQVVDPTTGTRLSVPIRTPTPPTNWADQFRYDEKSNRLRQVRLQHREVAQSPWQDYTP